MLAVEMTGL